MSVADLKVRSALNDISPSNMVYKGDWLVGGLYQLNDVVIAPDNSTYICIAPSGSTGVDPSTAPLAWTEIGGNASGSVQSLNGQAGTITLTGTNITVGSTGVGNISLTNAGVLGVSSGNSGISIGGTAQNPSVSNAGVLGVSSGNSGISIGGTAQNPSVSNDGILSITGSTNVTVSAGQTPTISLTNSQLDLIPGSTAITTINGANQTAFITIPSLGTSNIPVVAGGVYCLQGIFNITSTNFATYAINFFLNNGLIDTYVLRASSPQFAPSNPFSGANLPFSVMVIPVSTSVQFVISSGTAAGGDITEIQISDLYVTRVV